MDTTGFSPERLVGRVVPCCVLADGPVAIVIGGAMTPSVVRIPLSSRSDIDMPVVIDVPRTIVRRVVWSGLVCGRCCVKSVMESSCANED